MHERDIVLPLGRPPVEEEREILEDLIIAACDDARKKAEGAAEEKMKAVTAGLPLPPGFKLPF